MISKTDKSLSDIFDVDLVTHDLVPLDTADVGDDNKVSKIDDDFELARVTMRAVLAKGAYVLESASLVANGGEDPEAFTAVSSIMGQLASISEKLVGLHDKKNKAKGLAKPSGPEGLPSPGTTINGPVFVGSTVELAKLIKENSKPVTIEEEKDVTPKD